ncbi:MAG: hypothetical protein PSX37_14270, partial [bacterium]|nr:hypothetical protein [bacterium]
MRVEVTELGVEPVHPEPIEPGASTVVAQHPTCATVGIGGFDEFPDGTQLVDRPDDHGPLAITVDELDVALLGPVQDPAEAIDDRIDVLDQVDAGDRSDQGARRK